MKTPYEPLIERLRQRGRACSPLDWAERPEAGEAWPDKIRIEVKGDVRWGEQGSFAEYIAAISRSRYLTTQPTLGRRYRSDITCGPSVTGVLRTTMRTNRRADERSPGLASFTASLNVNVTTVRALAVRRNSQPLSALSISSFFRPRSHVEEVFREGQYGEPYEVTLDDSENVLMSVAEAGGETKQERIAARDAFLPVFEEKLRELLADMLSAQPAIGQEELNSEYEIDIIWNELLLKTAELYFERSQSAPVQKVMRISDRGFELARSSNFNYFIRGVSDHDVSIFGKGLLYVYPHIVIPLTGTRNIELSIYAKTDKRIRFEIR